MIAHCLSDIGTPDPEQRFASSFAWTSTAPMPMP